jgi:hypothetical protein
VELECQKFFSLKGRLDKGKFMYGLQKQATRISLPRSYSDVAIVGRIAYQANVLVQDTEPDLDSLLLSLGQGEFVPALSVSVTGGSGFLLFGLKVTLTGPVPQGDSPWRSYWNRTTCKTCLWRNYWDDGRTLSN